MTSGVTDTAVDEGRFLVCDGADDLNRVDYAGLFTVIGETFGPGDGATTFGIPNMFDGYIYAKGSSGSGLHPLGSGKIGKVIYIIGTESDPDRVLTVTELVMKVLLQQAPLLLFTPAPLLARFKMR